MATDARKTGRKRLVAAALLAVAGIVGVGLSVWWYVGRDHTGLNPRTMAWVLRSIHTAQEVYREHHSDSPPTYASDLQTLAAPFADLPRDESPLDRRLASGSGYGYRWRIVPYETPSGDVLPFTEGFATVAEPVDPELVELGLHFYGDHTGIVTSRKGGPAGPEDEVIFPPGR